MIQHMAEGISRYSVPPSAGPLLPLAVAPVMTAWKDRPLSVLMGDKLRRHRATACRGRGGMLAVELTPRASNVSVCTRPALVSTRSHVSRAHRLGRPSRHS